MQYARVVDGIVVELQPEFHPDGFPFNECFPPETAALFQQIEDGVSAGDSYPLAAPTIVTVPYASQSGAALDCTMGTWNNTPTDYTYQWMRDGSTVVGTGNTYTITADDIGHMMTCVVTASNDIGSTAAPPSNGVEVV